MIIRQTKLKVSDNSGAETVRCIGILGGTRKRVAKVGEYIVCSVLSLKKSIKNQKVKKGEVKIAMVVNTVSAIRRKDGSELSFKHNTVVLLDQSRKMIGTRVFGIMPRNELQRTALSSILSMTKEGVI